MSNSRPALKRLDHIICRVPDIDGFHVHFRDVLGFPEAWPIGRFWPEGRTSGIALGGINLEFIQPDEGAPASAVTDTLVFEPTSLEAAVHQFEELGVATRRFDKVEPDPDLLALRGFQGSELSSPQLICRNLLLNSPFPVPMFLCEYTPMLHQRLSPDNPWLKTRYGRVRAIHIRCNEQGAVEKLLALGYEGDIAISQDNSPGSPQITSVHLESGPQDLKGMDPGFIFA